MLLGLAGRRWVARVRLTAVLALVCFLAAASVAALLVLAIRIPHWQSLIDSIKEPKDRIAAENDVIRNVIQILGGALFLLGVYFTWRNLRVAQEGQITQRFNDAIEHLGSEKAEIRLGGIYALARIARDSPKDHMAVMHVFSAYVRETTTRSKQEPVAPEVQAILTMIAHRAVEHEPEDEHIELNDAWIPGVNLRDAQLERVRFDGANLSRANAKGALLRGATFRGAVLQDCYVSKADLRDSDLTAADLRSASLRGAQLDGANIFGARLAEASLLGTDLSGVKNAIRQEIELAVTDETTIFPVYEDFVQVAIAEE
jgi:hypothetical protein